MLLVYTEAVVKRSFNKVYPQDLTVNVGDVIKDVIKVWTHPFCPSIHMSTFYLKIISNYIIYFHRLVMNGVREL